MTGAYVRIKRNGKWESVEIDQMTNKELADFEYNNPDDGWRWAKFLARWIRDNVDK